MEIIQLLLSGAINSLFLQLVRYHALIIASQSKEYLLKVFGISGDIDVMIRGVYVCECLRRHK